MTRWETLKTSRVNGSALKRLKWRLKKLIVTGTEFAKREKERHQRRSEENESKVS